MVTPQPSKQISDFNTPNNHPQLSKCTNIYKWFKNIVFRFYLSMVNSDLISDTHILSLNLNFWFYKVVPYHYWICVGPNSLKIKKRNIPLFKTDHSPNSRKSVHLFSTHNIFSKTDYYLLRKYCTVLTRMI